VRGTLIAVPALDVLGFDAGMRFAPSDQKYTAYTQPDMNRIFPGNDRGSVQERIADIYYRTIVEEADYLISFHGGGNKGIIGPFVACQHYEGHVGRESMRMAKAFGLDTIWKVPHWPGILSTEASILGKPAILPEIGGDAKRYPERDFVPIALDGLLNVMRELEMIDGEVKRPDSYQILGFEYLKANQGGIFQFKRYLGDRVERGELIGETVNLFGEVVESLRAPWGGVIYGIRTYPLVHPGDWLFMLSRGIHQTPLISRHEALGAKIAMAMNWELPTVYSSVEKEYWAVRKGGAGLSDLSSMGKLLVEGTGAEELLQYLFVNDIEGLRTGQVRYTCLCNSEGRMLDDDTVYKFSPDKFLVVTSTATREDTEEWFMEWEQKLGFDVTITNVTQSCCLLALQGPKAAAILGEAMGPEITKLNYFDFREMDYEGSSVIVSRTGFTGELGFEIYVPNEAAVSMWDRIMAAGASHGIEPVGIGAVLALRVEKGYLLWGRDIDKTTNPLEAGLGWTVKFSKDDFMGKDTLAALNERGLRREITGFTMQDKHVIPPKGSPIVVDGRMVGHVTSSTYSYLLDMSIGMGYVESKYRDAEKLLEIHVDGVRHMTEVSKLPFYDPQGEKLKTRL
jgi:aminomethyltransferase